jgi:hypothetical protein
MALGDVQIVELGPAVTVIPGDPDQLAAGVNP